MSGWTKGPWQAIGWTPPGIYGPGGLRDAVRVAKIDRRAEEAEANANLIAAAPSLAEALEKIDQTLVWGMDKAGTSLEIRHAMNEALKIARAALRSAKGE